MFEKKRKKLTDQYGETKLRNVWLSSAKIGTTSATKAFFFDEPEIGKMTQLVVNSANFITYTKAICVRIDDINEIGIVFCSRF